MMHSVEASVDESRSEASRTATVIGVVGSLKAGTPLLVLAGLLVLAAAAPGDSRARRNGLISFWTGTGTPAVWVMRPDGSRRRLVTRFAQPAKRGSFSPDGRRLVFDGTRTGTGPREDFDVQVVRLDGTGRRWLTRGPARDTGASWSPDGRTIIFQRRLGEGPSSIWTVRADGTAARRLAAGSDPCFSPSGRMIAFARDGVVYSMRSDGSDVRRLRHGPYDAYPSGWSSDGRQILFTVFSRTAHRAAVWVMRADGRDARRLTHGAYDVAAAWSPDGKGILFTRIVPSGNGERGVVALMSADGTRVRTLTRRGADEHATSWQAIH
jgi:Tol biopolymer transport system component